MKKLKWLFGLCLMILVVCGSGVSVQASDVGTDSETDVSDFIWTGNDDGTLTIAKYVGTDETVVVPSEIEGISVSAIGEEAFRECEILKHIIISEGIIDIRYHAFYFCKNLESIQLPNGLEIIGGAAFCGCHNLIDVNIPNTVREIEKDAFGVCLKLKTIKLPESLTVIKTNTFRSCKNLSIIGFPDGLTTIESCAFYDCEQLVKVVIPDSVKSIGWHVFGDDIKKNYNVTICANSNSYARAYANQKGIKFSCLNTHDWDKGTITTEATAIKDGIKTFTCTACKKTKTEKISKLGLPQNGKTVTEFKSNNTYKVTKSSAKNGTVELVKVSKSISSITIPDAVTVDGVTYKVTSVSKNVFKNNNKLKKVTIGKNITKINANTFYGCKNLKTITIKSTNLKSVGKNAFKGIHSKASIKVPKNKLSKYKKFLKGKGQKSTVKITK